MKPPKGPSIVEVAEAAQVSVATVSRVLSGKTEVAEDLRDRVHAAAKRLNYLPLRRRQKPPAPRAASDANSRLPSFAYLCQSAGKPDRVGWSPAFAAASSRLRAVNRNLIFHHLTSDAPLDRRILEEGQYAAVLALGIGSYKWKDAVLSSGLPSVRVGYFPVDIPIPQIVGDNFSGVLKLMEHLLSRGHTRIAIWRAYAGAPDGQARNLNEREKYAAYRFALTEAGIEFRKSWEINMPFDFTQIVPCAQRLLSVTPAPTALLIDNSWTLSRMLRFPLDRPNLPLDWLRAFECVQYIDTDLDHGAEESGFASVATPMGQIGDLAAELLLDEVGGQRYDRNLVLRVQPRFFAG